MNHVLRLKRLRLMSLLGVAGPGRTNSVKKRHSQRSFCCSTPALAFLGYRSQSAKFSHFADKHGNSYSLFFFDPSRSARDMLPVSHSTIRSFVRLLPAPVHRLLGFRMLAARRKRQKLLHKSLKSGTYRFACHRHKCFLTCFSS